MQQEKIILYTTFSKRKINFSYLPLRIEIVHVVRDEKGAQVTRQVTLEESQQILNRGAELSSELTARTRMMDAVTALLQGQGMRTKMEYNEIVAKAKVSGAVRWIDKLVMCCELTGFDWTRSGVRV